jgi:hypothetical protein
MKKARSEVAEGGMRREYDFSGAVRGKYFERFQQGGNLVLLDPDVSAAFPTSEAVNQALRSLSVERIRNGRVMRRPPSPQRRTKKRTVRTAAKTRRRGPRR